MYVSHYRPRQGGPKRPRRNSEGVNIDDEMQQLLLIEQSYAANSRVLTAVSEMIDTLIAAV